MVGLSATTSIIESGGMRDRTLIACKWCGRGILPRDVECAECAALAPTRLIIAGTRTFNDYDTFKSVVWLALRGNKWKPGAILSGGASGPDSLGERWGKEFGVTVERYPADWYAHGKKAGPMRNQVMVEKADALLVFWDGKSKGTRDIISRAQKADIRTHVYEFMSL